MGAKISLYTVTKAISVSNNFTVFNIPTLHCYMCKSTVQKVLDKQSMVPLRLKTFGDIWHIVKLVWYKHLDIYCTLQVLRYVL